MSFRLKTIIGIAIIEAALLLILVLASLHFLHTSNQEAMTNRVGSTMWTYTTTVKDAVISGDLATLDHFVSDLAAHEDIAYVRIRDAGGRVLSEHGRTNLLAKAFMKDTDIIDVDDGVFDVQGEIMEGGIGFGRVEAGFSLDYMEQTIVEARKWFAFIFFIAILLSALFSLALGAYLTKQLSRLREASSKISKGQFGYQVPVLGSDELAETSQAFNEMSIRLGKLYQEVRERELRTHAILDTAINAIITTDSRGAIQLFNPAAEKIFGYRVEEVTGQNLRVLMPKLFQSESDGYLTNYLISGNSKAISVGQEACGQRKDGTFFPIELAVGKAKLGNDSLFVGVIQDITERKAAEEALVQAKIDAEQSNRLKSEFLSMMSHELRTPLTVILGYLPLLKDEDKLLVPSKIAGIAEDIESSGNHLLTLINDLLDISKIEAGKITLDRQARPTDEVVNSVIATLRPAADKKGLSLEGRADTSLVFADEVRIKQILINLIGNAIKFTDQGSITVTACRKDALVEFSVMDTGHGIPGKDLPSIFEKFSQVDSSSTRRTGGTGLGLAITKLLVELHGGSINAASTPGEGTEFIFTIPNAKDGPHG
ncbi:MAG: PAS domain S-box protein [Candidatus Thiodiazotropha sp. (ex Dulcina madagascariensis)]|nr:PAS domain S-box protein [Candidatus Thiodiazotropha sp. (ex Dulcina madagascariensis)]MCU7928300.1 PAS domain S-box protein [Candidatus Thiodiazotropha sp. (ex Dulcina madagascariensis)]